jgi:hypothetical protein
MDAPRLPSPQARFAAALLDPDLDPGAALSESPASRTADHRRRRFDVHRNTVLGGLVRALAEGFPSVERLVGPAFFAAMAAEFVRAQPPQHPVLLAYGGGFADFVARFPPVAHLPYLADVARIDGLRRRAWHAVDIAAIGHGTLVGIEPRQLAGLRVALHPGVGLLGSPHPARTLWEAQNGDAPRLPVDWVAETVLVRRRGEAIHVDAVSGALLALLDGARRRPSLARLLDAADAVVAAATALAFATALHQGLLVEADALDRALATVPDATLFDTFLPPFPAPTTATRPSP